MKLSELKQDEKGIILKVHGYGAFRKRLIEMGFVTGKVVTVVKIAPLKGPIVYDIMGYKISLRRREAELIEMTGLEASKNIKDEIYEGTIDKHRVKETINRSAKQINIAIVGNPNAGKTTLFNYISHSKEKVGNYGGVTITSQIAKFKFGDYTFNLTDLPGTYSISAYSPEELFVRKHIADHSPDIVVNIIDSSNLERNLYLTTQLIDMDLKVVSALNMYDELEDSQSQLNYSRLGKMLGIPFCPTVSSKGKGISTLFNKIIEVYENRESTVRHIHINYGEVVENFIKKIRKYINTEIRVSSRYSPRFIAIKLLERDKDIEEFVKKNTDNYEEIVSAVVKERKYVEDYHNKTAETFIADLKYAFISGALKQTLVRGKPGKKKSDKIDAVLTNKIVGFPLFVFFMFITFYATFTLGSYPQGWIDTFFGWVGEGVNVLMPDGVLKDLISNGILAGVGGVIVFLPNILILFFFISLMESTGYMARTAFIMDKMMQKIGLHGKSFIPLIMGFGCNVPAIMSTRILENKKDRLITILINPFMSCSARLPVYILIISAFFPERPTLTLFGIYLTGILLAVIFAKIFSNTFFKKKRASFIMELPPYRMPTLKTIIIQMWHKSQQYLRKMGGIILVFSVIIWALWYYPENIEFSKDYDAIIQQKQEQINALSDTKRTVVLQYQDEIKAMEREKKIEKQKKSYIGRLGTFIEPIISPIGFDWKIGISLITGIVAKEIVVSTMSVIYTEGEDGKGENILRENLKAETDRKGNKRFTPLIGLLLIIFTLIYAPCIATIAAIKNETGSLWWTVFAFSYTTGLAWGLCFIIYQIAK